jgi:cation diffusion facilitator CzcD-associated flavoprotein CzcO
VLFAWRPKEFQGLTPSLSSHTCVYRSFAQFAGKQVLVVGSGQSALESGALLYEGGAAVEIVARSHRIDWLQGRLSKTLHRGLGKVIRRALYRAY